MLTSQYVRWRSIFEKNSAKHNNYVNEHLTRITEFQIFKIYQVKLWASNLIRWKLRNLVDLVVCTDAFVLYYLPYISYCVPFQYVYHVAKYVYHVLRQTYRRIKIWVNDLCRSWMWNSFEFYLLDVALFLPYLYLDKST